MRSVIGTAIGIAIGADISCFRASFERGVARICRGRGAELDVHGRGRIRKLGEDHESCMTCRLYSRRVLALDLEGGSLYVCSASYTAW